MCFSQGLRAVLWMLTAAVTRIAFRIDADCHDPLPVVYLQVENDKIKADLSCTPPLPLPAQGTTALSNTKIRVRDACPGGPPYRNHTNCFASEFFAAGSENP